MYKVPTPRFVLSVAAILFAVKSALAVSADPPSKDKVIAQNAATLAAMTSYHLKIKQFHHSELQPSAPQLLSEFECWRDGPRHRCLERFYLTLSGGKFVAIDKEFGQVSQSSSDGREIRSLTGWDPAHPTLISLKVPATAQSCDHPQGYLGPVKDKDLTLSGVRHSLWWTLLDGITLQELDREATLELSQGPRPGLVTLRLAETKKPDLKRYIGATFEVDLARGALVVGMQWKDPLGRMWRARVKDMTAVGGAWIPKFTESTIDDVPVHHSQVEVLSLNQPIAEKELRVEFPEGLRVRLANGMECVWGKDKPEITFQDEAQKGAMLSGIKIKTLRKAEAEAAKKAE